MGDIDLGDIGEFFFLWPYCQKNETFDALWKLYTKNDPLWESFFFFFFVVSPITAISFGRNGLFFLTSGRFVQNHHFLSFFVQKKQPVTAKWNGRNGENDKTKTKKLSQSGSFWYIIFKGGQMFHFCWH